MLFLIKHRAVALLNATALLVYLLKLQKYCPDISPNSTENELLNFL